MNKLIIFGALILPIMSFAQDLDEESGTAINKDQTERRKDGLLYAIDFVPDKLNQRTALINGSADLTSDAGGFSGKSGDRAIDLGMGGGDQSVLIPDAGFLNDATAVADELTFSIWVKKYDIARSSVFWAHSPSSSGGQRGFQAHTPWQDNVVYFDTAGCCDPNSQRISANINTFPTYIDDVTWWNSWHHFVFKKQGSRKTIWIDGRLFTAGKNIAPLPSDFTQIWLGSKTGGKTNNMHGLLDDFAVFGTALSSADIERLAAGDAPTSLAASTRILAYWDFNEVSSPNESGALLPYTGLVRQFYPSGKKQFETNYVNGQIQGLETQWYENGHKKSELNFVDGKPERSGTQWDENGEIIDAPSVPIVSSVHDDSGVRDAFSDPEVRDPGIYDSSGKKIFSVADTGNTESVATIDGVKNYRERVLTDLTSGQTYTYSHTWDQSMSDGAVFMNYHFNKRQWYWAEGKGIPLGGRVKGDSIRRIYKIDKSGMTTPEQGSHRILRFKDGKYVNEFGEPVYSLVGRFPGWCTIILGHKYYEQVYLSDAIDEIKIRREVEADRLANSNSIAMDMLKLGFKYETEVTNVFGNHYEMVYFTEIDGEIIILNQEQIKRLINKWLNLNKKTRVSTRPFVMPQGGSYISKRKAKKRGVEGIGKRSLVLEIKAIPEYMTEFRAAISQ